MTLLDVDFSRRHDVIDFVCGNSGFLGEKGDLLADPEETIVCARCESQAKLIGLPSCDEIVGRHCHVGGIKAYRTCCGGDE